MKMDPKRLRLLNPELEQVFLTVSAHKCRALPGLTSVLLFDGPAPNAIEMRIFNLGAIRSLDEIRPGHCRVGYENEAESLTGEAADQLVSLFVTSSVYGDGSSVARSIRSARRRDGIIRAWAWVRGMLFGGPER